KVGEKGGQLMIKRTIVTYLLMALTAAPLGVLAQTVSDSARDWAAVMTVHPGEKLVVKLRDGKSVEGTLSIVSDPPLTIHRNNRTIDLYQANILRVYRVTGISAAASTLIGTGVEAGGGAALGAATWKREEVPAPFFGGPTTRARAALLS